MSAGLEARPVTEPARGLPDVLAKGSKVVFWRCQPVDGRGADNRDLQLAGNGHSIGPHTTFGNTLGNTTQTRAPAS
jgi:hypothetical protein